MRSLRSAALAVGLSLVLSQIAAATAVAADDDMVGRRQALEPYFRTYRPDGSGPSPALLFVSGCFGFASRSAQSYTDMAEGWRAKGYVVIFVDYLAARGMNRCSGYPTTDDVGKDVLAVATYLQGQPFVKASQITAFGWSLGGGGALAALGQIGSGENSPLHAVVAYSPWGCGTLEPWSVKVPALVLMGANDETARPALCQQVFTQLPPGTPVETRVYPDAGHMFNLPGYGYNAAAAEAAAHDVDQFMSR